MAYIPGTPSDDTLTGTPGDDTIDAMGGNDTITPDTGNDTILGGDGDDRVFFNGNFTSADSVDGGTGNDQIILNGDYSAGVTFVSTTLTNVEAITLYGGHSYNLTTDDANVAAGQTMTIYAVPLLSTDVLTFNGGAETNGNFSVQGGAGADSITTGAGNDLINGKGGNDILTPGSGNDTVNGNDGDDKIYMSGNLNAADKIDGGAGTDTVYLNGDYSAGVTMAATTLSHVESIVLAAGHSYNLTTANANVDAGQTLTVDGSALGSGDVLSFSAAGDTDSNFNITGGAAADVIKTGSGVDTIHGGGGDDKIYFAGNLTAADTVDGGAGNDQVILSGNYYSTALTLGAGTLTGVEAITLLGSGNNYNITTNDANVAAGQTLTIYGVPAGILIFNGSAETDGNFIVQGGTYLNAVTGAGNDRIIGTASADLITPGAGNDYVDAGANNDTIYMFGNLNAADHIDGGAAIDNVILNGDYSAGLVLGTQTLLNIETITLTAGHSYNLTLNRQTFVNQGTDTVTVDGSTLGGSDSTVIDGSAAITGYVLYAYGGAGNDTLIGGESGDSLTPGAGDDIVHGNDGNDSIQMYGNLTAADQIDGGAGTNDRLLIARDWHTSQTVVLGPATVTNVETIVLQGVNDSPSGDGLYTLVTNDATVAAGQTLTFSLGALAAYDTVAIDGSAETDGNFYVDNGTNGATNLVSIYTGAGNDFIRGAVAAHPGMGNDWVSYTTTVYFDGTGSFTAADRVDHVGTIVLNGDYSAGVTFGTNTVSSSLGFTLMGGHSYNLTDSTVTDTQQQAPGASYQIDASTLGSSDALTFDGSAASSAFAYAVLGGAGNDSITVGAGNDTVTGGAGNDTIGTGAGNDTIDGGAGNDTINGGDGTDIITGGTGNDTLTGGAGDDRFLFHYGDGLDTIVDFGAGSSSGDVIVLGGYGISDFATLQTKMAQIGADTVITFDASNTITLHNVTMSQLNAGDFTFSYIAGSDSGETLNGTAGDDLIDAKGGNDVVNPGAGNDTVLGGDGDDQINFAGYFTAADTVDGGAGNDQIVLNGDYSAGVTFATSTMTNVEAITLYGGHSYNLTLNDANVAGGQGLKVYAVPLTTSDTLTFDASADTNSFFNVQGGAGVDTVKTGAGNDTINGNDGNDVLTGGAGKDVINGGNGDDTITGGTGNDTLTGGAGNDHFEFTLGDGRDTIMDFVPGNSSGDVIDLHGYGFANFAALQPHLMQSGSDTYVLLDGADQYNAANWILLHGVAASQLNAGDFTFT